MDKKNLSILSATIIPRLLAFLLLGFIVFPDYHTYMNAGKEILETGRTSITNVMPLFPLVVAIIDSKIALVSMNIALSCVSAILTYRLSMAIFEDETSALFASMSFGIYPFFVFYSLTGLTETMYITLLLSCFYLYYKDRWVLAHIVMILSILLRPTLDLLAPLLIASFAFINNDSLKTTAKKIACYFFIYILMFSPWWLHNYYQYGSFVRLNLGDGIVLYSGNNPLNTTGGGTVRADRSKDMDLSQFDKYSSPLEKNRAMKEAAYSFIRENPSKFAKLALLKASRFWRLYPFAPEYQNPLYKILSLLSFTPVLLLTIMFFLQNGRAYLKKTAPILGMCLYLTMVHMVTIGSLRYRLPLEPFMIIIASYQLIQTIRRLRHG